MKFLIALVLVLCLASPVCAMSARVPRYADLERILWAHRANGLCEGYQFQHWDCTNMAAVLDAALDAAGFRSFIVTGWQGVEVHATGEVRLVEVETNIWHAMLLVFCVGEDDRTVRSYWIEPTCCAISTSNTRFWPTRIFDTAEQAQAVHGSEFADTRELRGSEH